MAKKSADFKSMAGKLADVWLTAKLLPAPAVAEQAMALVNFCLQKSLEWAETEAREAALQAVRQ